MMRSTRSKTKLSPNDIAETNAPAVQFRFDAIGTAWAIDIFNELARAKAAELLKIIKKRAKIFDHHYSRFKADSLVSAMAKKRGIYTLPADSEAMLDLYRQLYDLTDGKMTPLVGGLLAEAGYDAAYSFHAGVLHRPPGWDEAVDYDFPTLIIKKPLLLDFGAAGKGYLVDIIARILEDFGCREYCVDGGGDMLYRSRNGRKLEVGLEHPKRQDQVIGIASISNQSICGSAGNRRNWGKYHHIIDPQTLTSPNHIRALWVIAESALLADALSTALFFTNPGNLTKHYAFEYAIIHNDYALERSMRFPASFFTKQ